VRKHLALALVAISALSLSTRAFGTDSDQSSPSFQPWGACTKSIYMGYAPRGVPKTETLPLKIKKTIWYDKQDTDRKHPKSHFYVLAEPLTPQTNLYAGQELIIDVEADEVGLDEDLVDATNNAILELPLISISFQSTAATPINPAPVRPSQSTNRKNQLESKHVCVSTVLRGDTSVTVEVSALQSSDGSPINLGSITLPQVHILDLFNVSTGLAASTLRDNNFNRVVKTPSDPTKDPAVPATYSTAQGKTGQRVSPALFFTWYLFHPMDPEVPFHRSDLIPEPAVGFSITNPGSDYYFGASSEFLVRNIQLVYGAHYGKVTEIAPDQVDDPYSSTAQTTQNKFVGKAFVGVTFNVDFIKSIFGK